MARETKAQRLEREAAEDASREEQLRQEYFPALMAALQTATWDFQFSLKVNSGNFYLGSPDKPDLYVFNSEYTPESWALLGELDFELDMLKREKEERQRAFLAKKAALAKLTQEERELLGL